MCSRSSARPVSLVAVLALALLLGCGTQPQPSTAATASQRSGPTPQHADPAAADASQPTRPDERLRRLAKFLPADTFCFVTIESGPIVRQGLLGEQWTNAIFGRARYEAMLADYSKLLLARLGVDPIAVDWVAVGVTEQELVVVFLGGATLAPNVQRASVAGLPAIRVQDASFFELPKGDVLAWLPDEHIEAWSSVVQGNAPNLAGTARYEELTAALGRTPAAMVRAVTRLDVDAVRIDASAEGYDLQGLRAAGLTLGGSPELSVWVEGDEQTINVLRGLYTVALVGLQAKVDALYATVATGDTMDGVGAIMAKHAFAGARKVLAPRFEGELAALSIDLPSGGWANATPIVGILAAVAVPAFLTYIRKSKAAEAKENLVRLGQGALLGFETQRQAADSAAATAQFPLAGAALCTAPWDADGGKLAHDATPPDVWELFEHELGFSVPGAHYYQYCYSASPDGTEFWATAEAALSKGELDSRYVIHGTVVAGEPVLTAVLEEL